MASYHVIYEVTKSKKSHTIAEEVIKTCELEMEKIDLGKETSTSLNWCRYQMMLFRGELVI